MSFFGIYLQLTDCLQIQSLGTSVNLIIRKNCPNPDRKPDFTTSFPVFAFTAIAGKLLIVEISGFHHRVPCHCGEARFAISVLSKY